MKKNTYNILIVEDEIPARDLMINLVLSRSELHLRGIAKNGEEALEKLQKESYDLVFLDIHLPVFSGIEILESLDKFPEIIFTTAFDNYAITAFDLNAVDYLIKPFTKK
jgi:two-component system LytT family response regulator